MTEPAMIISMPTIVRSQQRYDHRLRDLVQRTGDVTVATNLGVPRSTARGRLGETPTVVVCLDVTELTEPKLRQEVIRLRRRVRKLTALLRLALALLQASWFRLSVARRLSVFRIEQAERCWSPWTLFADGTALYPRANVVPGIPFYFYGSQYSGGKVLNNTPNECGPARRAILSATPANVSVAAAK